MIARGYGDRSPLAGPVYCDASFLMDLFVDHVGPANLAGHLKNRAKNGHAFYIWARLQGVTFVTSFLALQECYHNVLFGELRTQWKTAGYQSWKEYRRNDPAGFAATMSRARGILARFHTFFTVSGIKLVTFGTGTWTGLLLREPHLTRYARGVLATCHVDTMDAFHYAIMRRCRIDAAVSTDRDWTSLPKGTLVAP